jgi:hypothetical protein
VTQRLVIKYRTCAIERTRQQASKETGWKNVKVMPSEYRYDEKQKEGCHARSDRNDEQWTKPIPYGCLAKNRSKSQK